LDAPHAHRVDRRALVRVVCHDLDVSQVAELSKLPGGSVVLKQNRADIERIQFADTKAIAPATCATSSEKSCLVVRRHYLACSLMLWLR
jgi:hypothetical protein